MAQSHLIALLARELSAFLCASNARCTAFRAALHSPVAQLAMQFNIQEGLL
ncbi:hypothetical protein KTD31_00460 [Burkholderia multivorans]|uniref:hypothetical protein n=1 Tax=Burkholderia multivorans TaxID=87883 RepID=UPI001C23DDC2|nr:hypothetical protein [Burkholderia multivorans]MBU9199871.1 hypothetical protein [Burkholderia multivorans]MDN8079010.1 hypothetical protein [Burkholderia multivorans]